ncbi:hypothetical protein BH11VER1_BH11VER1_06100 [soil metagenome]
MNWREHFQSRPLATLSLAAVAGITAAEHLATGGLFYHAIAIGSAIMAWRHRHLFWLLLLTFLVFMGLHQVAIQTTGEHPLRNYLQRRMTRLDVVVKGSVKQTLRRDLPGSASGEALFQATEITAPSAGRKWDGSTMLRLTLERGTSLTPGEYQIEGWLQLPPAADNPGQFKERDYDQRQGLVAELRAQKVMCLREHRGSLTGWLQQVSERCRQWVTETLSVDLQSAPEERAVILAMAMGTNEAGAREMKQPFLNSGTLHVFSVSGLHVGIVGLIFWMLLKPLGAPRSVMLMLLIPTMFGYAFITGFQPAAVRAAIMAAVFLCGAIWHRRADMLNSLGASALILLAWDTQQLFAPGFQLSFGVLAAIGLLNKKISLPFRAITEPDLYLPKSLLTGWQTFWWNRRREIAGLLSVSLAAWIGSLPLLLWHFQQATPVALIANLVLVPLSFCVLFTAIMTVISGGLKLSLAQGLFSNANLGLTKLTIFSAQCFAAIPGGNFHVSPDLFTHQPSAELTVLRLPAGGGAQHLRVGREHWMLDVGDTEQFVSLLQPYLRYQGVDHLTGMILSHSDFEHSGAATKMQRDYTIPLVFRSALDLSVHAFHAMPLVQGETLALDISAHPIHHAQVLYSPRQASTRRADDRALVMRFDLGDFKVLWCNDAGFLAEKTMLDAWPEEELRCDVVIRNQHAGDFSLLPEFLDAVKPRLVISSHQNFPVDEKLPERIKMNCANRGIILMNQAETGAVTLKFWPRKLEVAGFRGTHLTLTPLNP